MPALRKTGTAPRVTWRAHVVLKTRALDELRAAFRKGVAKGLMDMGDAILNESQRRVPTGATTGLKDSGVREPAKPTDWVQVVYSAPYALFVHEGTKAHMPPVEALVRWCELVLGIHGPAARRAAWGVARAIAAHGTKPNKFLTDAAAVVWPKAEEMLSRGIRGEIDRIARAEAIRVLTSAAAYEVARSESREGER